MILCLINKDFGVHRALSLKIIQIINVEIDR